MAKYRLTELQLLSISITSSIILGLVFTSFTNDQNPLLLPNRSLAGYMAQSIAPLLLGAIFAGLARMFCQVKYIKIFTYSNFAIALLVLISLITNTYPQYKHPTFSEPVQNASFSEKRVESEIKQHDSKKFSDQQIPSMTYDEEGKLREHFFAIAKYVTEQAKKHPTTRITPARDFSRSRKIFIEAFNSEFAQRIPDGLFVYAYPVDLKARKGVGIVVAHYIDKLPTENKSAINKGMEKMKPYLYFSFCPVLKATNFKTHILYMTAYRTDNGDRVLGDTTFNWSDCKKNTNLWQ